MLKPFCQDSSSTDQELSIKPKRQRTMNSSAESELPLDSLFLNANLASASDNNIYQSFLHHITSGDATLCWRVHQEDLDVVVMNDMDAQTGLVQPSSLVHVTRQQHTSSVSYSCTYQVYRYVQSTQLSGSDVTANLDDTIAFPATCAHCRFMKEQVETHLTSLFQHNPPQDKMEEILSTSICSLNRSVVQVGSYTTQTVVKFSVVCSGSSCAFVHVTRYGFISCKSGECKARATTTKGVKSLQSLLALLIAYFQVVNVIPCKLYLSGI